MSMPFFAMRNVHGADANKPPIFQNGSAAKYHGYFENYYGEQWVIVYDRETKMAELCGSTGWQNVYPVTDGRVHGVMMNHDELQWLRTCWAAATGTHERRGKLRRDRETSHLTPPFNSRLRLMMGSSV